MVLFYSVCLAELCAHRQKEKMIRFRLKKICISALAAVITLTMLTACSGNILTDTVPAAEDNMFADDPNISRQTKAVIRVGLFRGEDYDYWNSELKSMGAELLHSRLITSYQARNYESMEDTWAALCSSMGMASRGRLEFVEDAFYTLDRMSDGEIDEMFDRDDLDLMLTFGTASGKVMTANADRIAYDFMVYGATNTVNSGIVKSETERFSDNAFAQVDTEETRRTMQSAYDLFHFQNVGVVYEDNEDAYIYSGVDVLDEMAETYGFTVHKVFVNESAGPEDDERFYTELKAAYDSLLPKIDTLIITTSTIEDDKIPELLEDIIEAGIVTISQESEEQCRMGALMFLLVASAEEDGMFMAKTIGDYCQGTPIADLPMVYVSQPKLFLNYETIKRTGVRIPMKAFMIADTIYTKEDMQ